MCAEKCVPLQIIFTQEKHPVREAIQSTMLRMSFILSKKKCLFLTMQRLDLLVEYFILNSGLCIQDMLSFSFLASLFLLAD